MATKKLDDYIVKAFKDLGFTDNDIFNGCWLLERENKKTGEMIKVAWIAYHKFLERAAQMAGIIFDEPKVLNLEQNEIALFVKGTKDNFSAWAIGEASSGNLTTTSKNYRWAMAEKRAKDRVILKLLGIAGDMYSEEEADEFKDKPQKKETPDFEKEATAQKTATTKAINKAIKEGTEFVKPKTKGTLTERYDKAQAWIKTLEIWSPTPAQRDSLNTLLDDLKAEGEMEKFYSLSEVLDAKDNLKDDRIVY